MKQALKKKTILLPDIDWIEIPEGTWTFKYQDKWRNIYLKRFFISRYLVTNSQYQSFIDGRGYEDERWWQDLIKPEPEKPSWPQPNRPREKVDWYEAVAFTRWLSKQLGFDISLPTEQQWEKAARGEDGREYYPWGERFETGDTNVFDLSAGEQNLEQTSAVGLYPHRASPYDVLDMAGNVWEWCLNKYDKPDYIQADNSGDMRVVRGGSWSDYPEYARCANRTRGNPDYRYGSRGFRVVCSSPFTDH